MGDIFGRRNATVGSGNTTTEGLDTKDEKGDIGILPEERQEVSKRKS